MYFPMGEKKFPLERFSKKRNQALNLNDLEGNQGSR